MRHPPLIIGHPAFHNTSPTPETVVKGAALWLPLLRGVFLCFRYMRNTAREALAISFVSFIMENHRIVTEKK